MKPGSFARLVRNRLRFRIKTRDTKKNNTQLGNEDMRGDTDRVSMLITQRRRNLRVKPNRSRTG